MQPSVTAFLIIALTDFRVISKNVGQLYLKLHYVNQNHRIADGRKCGSWVDTNGCNLYYSICVSSSQYSSCDMMHELTQPSWISYSDQASFNGVIFLPNSEVFSLSITVIEFSMDKLICKFENQDVYLRNLSTQPKIVPLSRTDPVQKNKARIKATMWKVCNPDYFGDTCQQVRTPSPKVNSYESTGTTLCPPGSKCIEELDPCSDLPCGDNGICTLNNNSFLCKCNPGWSGMACEVAVEKNPEIALPCQMAENLNGNTSACQHGGICVNEPDGSNFTCSCVGLWQGDLCEIHITDTILFLATAPTFSIVCLLSILCLLAYGCWKFGLKKRRRECVFTYPSGNYRSQRPPNQDQNMDVYHIYDECGDPYYYNTNILLPGYSSHNKVGQNPSNEDSWDTPPLPPRTQFSPPSQMLTTTNSPDDVDRSPPAIYLNVIN